MAEDRIDSIVDLQATQREIDALQAQLQDVVKAIQAVKSTGIKINGAASVSEYNELKRQLDILTRQSNAAAKAAIEEARARQQAAKAAEAEAKASEAAAKAKVAETKATEQSAKAKQLEEKYTANLIKEKEKLNKEAIKEANHLGKLNNEYEQLKHKYLIAANTAKQLAAANGLNNAETLEAIAVAAKYNQQLFKIEQAVGQSQRNVGNYTSATFALTQVLREAPAFANSFATGISGISNNVPILIDEIRKLNAANVELRAQGLKTIPVFSTLAKSIFSISGILPIAFLGFQLLASSMGGASKKSQEMTDDMKRLEKELDDVKKAIEELNEEASFLSRLGKINIEANFEKGGDLLALQGDMVKSMEVAYELEEALKKVNAEREELYKRRDRDPDEYYNTLTLKEFNDELEKNYQKREEIWNAQEKNGKEQMIIRAQIRAQRVKDRREEEKDAKDAAERRRKDALELFRQEQQALIEEQKIRVERARDGNKTAARQKLYELEVELISGVAKFEIQQRGITSLEVDRILKKEARDLKNAHAAKIRETELYIILERNLMLEGLDETAAALAEKQKEIDDAEKLRTQSQAIDNLTDDLKRRLRYIEEAATRELQVQAAMYEKGKINKQQYEKAKLAIENKQLADSLQAQIDYYEKLIMISDLPSEEQKKAIEELHSLRQQLAKLGIKQAEDNATKQIEIEKKKNEAIKNLTQELVGLTFDLFTAGIDRQRNALQDQLDLLDEQKAKDIETVNQTVANRQEAANQIAIIEARAQGQREAIERRQRQLQQERARYEKAQSIANIIQSTAVAVVSALGAKPWTPANIALAALVGAIGAAQIVRVLATPIPRYKHGTKDHRGGIAEVGHGKQEVIVTPGGAASITPATPTLVDIPKHSVVYPSIEDYAKHIHLSPAAAVTKVSNDLTPVTGAIKHMEKTVAKAIKNKKEYHFRGEPRHKIMLRQGNTFRQYLNGTL